MVDQRGTTFCLLYPEHSPAITAYIKDNFSVIIDHLIKAIDEPEMATKLPEIFKRYDQNYNEYFEEDSEVEKLSAMITKAANYDHRLQKNILESSVLNLFQVENTYMRIYQADQALKNVLLPGVERGIRFERPIDREFWEAKIDENAILEKEKIKNIERLTHYYKNSTLRAKNEEKAIDELFYNADYKKVIDEDTPVVSSWVFN